MEIEAIAKIIEQFGLPIGIIIILMGIGYITFNKMINQSEAHFQELQQNCKSREEKLYAEIKENREINRTAIETIAKYAEKLDVIQDDIDDIKTNITVLATKVK